MKGLKVLLVAMFVVCLFSVPANADCGRADGSCNARRTVVVKKLKSWRPLRALVLRRGRGC